GVVDPPHEECDLGDAFNGQPGSPCTASCLIQGHCTGNGATCHDASDCPAGQGCCGNAIQEGDEQCDDGNANPDDACDDCHASIPVLGCEALAGSILPAFVRRAKFKATTPGAFDSWRTKGDFNLPPGVSVDPDSEQVRLVFNQGTTSTPLYDAVLPPGSFVQGGSSVKPRWKFTSRDGSVPQALGWQSALFRLLVNKVAYVLGGAGVEIPIDGSTPLRQTIRIGDTCASVRLDCTTASSGRTLLCESRPEAVTTTTTMVTTSTTTSTTIAACSPVDGSSRLFAIDFAPPAGIDVAGITVLVDYPEAQVTIPGSGNATSVKQSILDVPQGAISSPNDLDDALREAIASTAALPPGRLFTIQFEDCQGATPPVAGD